MELNAIKIYEGKKVLIILKNGFQYNTILPNITSHTFTIIDKYGEEISIDCDFVNFIKEVKG